MTAVPTGNQVLQYDKGAPFVLSNGQNTRASLSIEVISKSEARLWLGVFNGQDVPITVFAEGASAVSDGKPLQILGVAELTKKLKRKSMWERIGAGAAAGANSYTASQQGRTTSESTHSGTINNYRSGGNTSLDYQGRTTTRTDDPIARRQAQESAIAKNSEMIGSIRANQAIETSALNDSVFQTQTIQPRGTYMGFLQLELPRKSGTQTSPIEVSLIAGPDTHRYFVFLDRPATQQQRDAITSIGIQTSNKDVDVQGRDEQPIDANDAGFYDNGNGTLTDTKTGLVWTQRDNGSDINWEGAKTYCASKNMRLPGIEELAEIYNRPGGDIVSCNIATGQYAGNYTCKASSLFRLSSPGFWSGTQGDAYVAWKYFLLDGDRNTFDIASDTARALCVGGRS